MTTIATDGKVMAADGRATLTDGTILSDEIEKLSRGKDGSILGLAGPTGANALVHEWFAKGEDYRTIPKLRLAPDDGFEGLILRPDGSVEFLDMNFTRVFFATAPVAVGSGGAIAVGAMLAGKSPADAVEIAALRDSGTGPIVTELTPGKARKSRK